MRGVERALLLLASLCIGAAGGCAEDVEFQPVGGNGFPAGCTSQPVFNLLTPQNETTVDAIIPYHLEVGGFTLAPDKIGGEPGICEGHLHIFAGNDVLSITAETQVDFDVPDEIQSGDHFEFRVVVVHNNHAPVDGIDPIVVNLLKQ